MHILLTFILSTVICINSNTNNIVNTYPNMNNITNKIPNNISIAFTNNLYLIGPLSYIQVYGPNSKEVSIGDTIKTNNKTMNVPINQDGYGIYIVKWHIVSDNMSEQNGYYTFTVSQFNTNIDNLNYMLFVIIGLLCLSNIYLIFIRKRHTCN